MSPKQKQKVLYIAGNGRSGSTLFDVILGQVPGFFPVGEVRDVWDYGLVENRLCGCGVPLRECATWREIFRDELANGIDPAQVARWRERFAQTKCLLPIFLRGDRYLDHPSSGIREYLNVIERLYHNIARVTDARVIVDSSKWPTYAFLLDNLASIDLYVLHLVRDPRACAFSWRRHKQTEPGKYLDRQGPIYTTSYWAIWNPAIRRLFGQRQHRYMFLRYEDFASRPRETVDEVLRFVDESEAQSPFIDTNTVPLSPSHSVEGNAARFARGEIRIQVDTEWRQKMSWVNKAIVTVMTWPLLWRYGYFSEGDSNTAADFE